MVETWQRPGENWSSILMVLSDSEQGMSLLQSSREDTVLLSTSHYRQEAVLQIREDYIADSGSKACKFIRAYHVRMTNNNYSYLKITVFYKLVKNQVIFVKNIIKYCINLCSWIRGSKKGWIQIQNTGTQSSVIRQ
jgi:hypothetical protein